MKEKERKREIKICFRNQIINLLKHTHTHREREREINKWYRLFRGKGRERERDRDRDRDRDERSNDVGYLQGIPSMFSSSSSSSWSTTTRSICISSGPPEAGTASMLASICIARGERISDSNKNKYWSHFHTRLISVCLCLQLLSQKGFLQRSYKGLRVQAPCLPHA